VEALRRVTIHDKPPIFDGALIAHPLNRITLGIGTLALVAQAVGLVQVMAGHGNSVGILDRASFPFVAFIWLLLGVTVFVQRAGTPAARFFLLSAAAGSTFLGVGTLSGVSWPDALLYSGGILLLAPTTWGFVRALAGHRMPLWREVLLYVPPVALIPPMASDLIYGHKQLGFRLGVASVGIYLLAAVVQSARGLAAARKPEAAAQMRAVLFGLVAGTLPGILLYVVPLAFFGQQLVVTTWQPLIALLFVLAMSYAALQFELTEADLIVRRSIVYGCMTSVIVTAYATFGAALAAGRFSVFNSAIVFGFVCVTLLVGTALIPARQIAHSFVDWLLYGGTTDRWSLLHTLNLRLGSVMRPQDLGEILTTDLKEALRLRGALFFRRQEDVFICTTSVGQYGWEGDPPRESSVHRRLAASDVHAALGEPPESLLLVHTKPVFSSGRDRVPPEYRIFDDFGASLIIPLTTGSGLEAILCLGRKETHDAFTADDLQLLAPIVGRASVGLDNALLFSRLDDTVLELREAYIRLAQEQETERSRLARELHDGTSQELSTLITLVTVLERQYASADVDISQTLCRLRQQAEEAYGGVRRASHALQPVILDGRGLVPALVHYLDQFRAVTRIDVDLAADEVGALPQQFELALFRVAQECMENVRKHSGSPTAQVRLTHRDDTICLTVSDQGRGIEQATDGGIGMVSMRERLTSVGGTLQVHSARGQGVCIDAVVPLPR
jgi:signal transduction histidine kinase